MKDRSTSPLRAFSHNRMITGRLFNEIAASPFNYSFTKDKEACLYKSLICFLRAQFCREYGSKSIEWHEVQIFELNSTPIQLIEKFNQKAFQYTEL